LDPDDAPISSLANDFVNVVYAIALGLMVVGVQGGYTEVQKFVMHEAYTVGEVFIDAYGLPEPTPGAVQRSVL
jgi:hypothetical protein